MFQNHKIGSLTLIKPKLNHEVYNRYIGLSGKIIIINEEKHLDIE
jgi:hypothetical protein